MRKTKMTKDANKIARLRVICGPMFSGKSTRLYEEYCKAKQVEECVIITHSLDNRTKIEDEKRYITQHRVDDTKKNIHYSLCEAESWNSTKELYENLCEKIDNVGHVFIDEGQFFEDISYYCGLLRNQGISITVAGLDLAHDKSDFVYMKELIDICNEVTYTTSFCHRCNNIAKYTWRITHEKEQIVVGGCDKYAAVCSPCYHELKYFRLND